VGIVPLPSVPHDLELQIPAIHRVVQHDLLAQMEPEALHGGEADQRRGTLVLKCIDAFP
jgi:hypothetical protein